MKSAVRVIHTVFRCVFFGKPSGDETAFSTWTSESFSMEQSSTKMTRQVPKATRNDIWILFNTIDGDLSLSISDLRILGKSSFFSEILAKAYEQDKNVFESNLFSRVSSESLKTTLEHALCFRSPDKEMLPMDTLIAKTIYGLCVRCDLPDLKDICDSVLLKDLNVDSAVEYLNLAIADSFFLQGAYRGRQLIYRCSGLIVENLIEVSKIGDNSNETWGTVVDFTFAELKRRLSHPDCVIQCPSEMRCIHHSNGNSH